MIHHAARRADDDLRALAQAAELAVVTLPAVNRQLAHAALEGRELRDFLGDLHRQFARRTQNQHLRRAQIRIHSLDRREWRTPPSFPSRSAIARPRRARRAAAGIASDWIGDASSKPICVDGLEQLRRQAELGEKFLLHQGL